MTGVCTEEGLFFSMFLFISEISYFLWNSVPGKKPTEQDLNEVVNFAVHEAEDKNAIAVSGPFPFSKCEFNFQADLKSVYLPDGIPADKDVFMRSIANVDK